MDHYIIVGRKIDGGNTKYLHSDGTIDKSPQKDGADGTALNVEFIGKTVVELSKKDPVDKDSAEYKRVTEHIRNALVVLGPDGHDPNDPELERILDNVTVELEHDTRDVVDGATDTNIRKLVIPAQGSFDYREKYFGDKEPNPGFEPPLTYELDKMMMKLYFSNLIDEVLHDFAHADGTGLDDTVKEALLTQVEEKLGSYKAVVDDAEDATEKIKANILTTPVSAFYRAVGIYITNMCD